MKNDYIRLRCTTEEKQQIKAQARESTDKNMSTYILNRLLKENEHGKKEVHE